MLEEPHWKKKKRKKFKRWKKGTIKNEKKSHRMGENIYKQIYWEGINLQYIQIAHVEEY